MPTKEGSYSAQIWVRFNDLVYYSNALYFIIKKHFDVLLN